MEPDNSKTPIPVKSSGCPSRQSPDVIPWPKTGLHLAAASGVFCVIIVILLVINHWQSKALDPLNSVELAQLKATLTKSPTDEALKQRIRTLDLQLRQQWTRKLELSRQGAWLLLGGIVVCLLSLKPATYRKKLPRPQKADLSIQAGERALAQGRWAVTSLGVILLGVSWVISSQSQSPLTTEMAQKAEDKPESQSTPEPTSPALAKIPSTPFPSPAEIQRNWPRFRGPNGSGVSAFTNVPTLLQGETGENILWKASIPLIGPDSPLVWDNLVFVLGATAKKRDFFCFDAHTGKLLWQKSVGDLPETSPEIPTVMEDTGGYASATGATDGRRVYGVFANSDIAAFDYAGNRVWARNLGQLDNGYGHASSLEYYQDRLLVQLDQAGPKDNKSKLLALDTATGKTVWESAPRPVPGSWASPIVISVNQKAQVITCANPWVISYDPANGSEIWRAQVLYGEVTPSPIYGAGMVFTVIEGEKLSAIKPDGSGNVTKTHVPWSADEGLPDIASPLCDGERVYLTTSGGIITCYDAKSGKKLWEKENELSFKSSPSLAGDRIYVFDEKGVVVVFQAASEYKEIGRSKIGDEVFSCPAFADGKIFLRTKHNLICFADKKR